VTEQLQRLAAFHDRVSRQINDIVRYLSPRESMPVTVDGQVAMMAQLPLVADWWRASACRLGASLALAMTVARYPRANVARITSGVPVDATGQPANLEELTADMVRYGSRVERMLNLNDLVFDEVAPEDAQGGPPALPDTDLLFLLAAQHPEIRPTPSDSAAMTPSAAPGPGSGAPAAGSAPPA